MKTAEELNAFGAAYLPGSAGIEIRSVSGFPPRIEAVMPVHRALMAPNDCLHGGAVMVLGDTCAGYGAFLSLPPGASGFLTVEMKANHLAAVREGSVRCVATARHAGRTTQVWEAELTQADSGRLVALFRCTQLILYSAAQAPA